jgi:ribose transport system substrate-binding protein
VEALDEYRNYGNTSQYFSADVTIIDRSNVASFMQKEETDEK